VITFQAKGSRPPLIFLHGDWGGGGLYCGYLAQKLGDDQPFYALSPYHSGRKEVLPMEEMVNAHIADIRSIAPHGPYLLGGYCIGALVAIEAARKLVAQGEDVRHLLLIDFPVWPVDQVRKIWDAVDKFGNVLGWDLIKKIAFLDRSPLSFLRWWKMPLQHKISALAQRLGFKNAGRSASPVMGLENVDALRLLKGEDYPNYAVYFLTSCLHPLNSLNVPLTVYIPQQPSNFDVRIARAKAIFPLANIELVPGGHHTCITQHATVLADRMKNNLNSLYLPVTTG
jgi:pimeloyl-ACP methyl ester carboxylesterase